MANFEQVDDDLSYSIRIDFGLRVRQEFSPLINWFSQVLFTPRQAARGQHGQRLEAISCVLANFATAAKIDPDLHIGCPFNAGAYTQTRYNQSGLGYRNFVRVIRRFRRNAQHFITYHRGIDYPHIGRVGRIRATDRTLRILFGFAALIRRDDYDGAAIVTNEVINDLAAIPLRESITQLRQEQILEPQRELIILRNVDRQNIEYPDTVETNALRESLGAWNSFLSENFHADLLLPDDQLLDVFSDARDQREVEEFFGDLGDPPSVVELRKTTLYRIFNHGSFDRGGRFYGGWWQTIPSRFRRYITVNAVPTVEVDYSNLHPAMLYAEEGLQLPGDAYALDGLDPDRYRKLIKKTLLRLINAEPGQRIRLPQEHALPDDWTWEQLQQALIEKHQPIVRHLRSGAGLRLMRIDSDIAARVMQNMHEHDRPVLPVHDSFLTYLGSGDLLQREMLDAYTETTGYEINVDPEDFIGSIFPIAENEWPLNRADQIDIALREPEYAGYRARWEAFVATRTQEWRRRFGEGIEALDGL